MELVENGSLDDVLERGETLAPERARRYMLQVARGLRAAHRAGIVHRDIKPSNLLVDVDDQVKIADFGIACRAGHRRSGMFEGTPLYASPEQIQKTEVDHRSDMYSLGCTFFHLLSGCAPFDHSCVIDILHAHVHAPRPKLRGPIGRVIERLMARAPEDRFQSYDELEAAGQAADAHPTARRWGSRARPFERWSCCGTPSFSASCSR